MTLLKQSFIAVACLLSGFAEASAAEPPNPAPEELQRLIDDINSYTQARSYAETIKDKASASEAVALARSKLAAAKASIPKLRKLIRTGGSIFDYPGLLTRGPITYDRTGASGSYCLFISATFAPSPEGTNLPSEFRLYFDDRGTITSISDVLWRH